MFPKEINFDFIMTLLDMLCNSFGSVLEYFNSSVRDIVTQNLASYGGPNLWELILQINAPWLDMPLYSFMLGSGLIIYLGYQFVVWILNIIT